MTTTTTVKTPGPAVVTTTTDTKTRTAKPCAPSLKDMLAVAAAAKAKAAREAAAAARKQTAQEIKDAEKATTAFWTDLSDAAAAAKDTAGYPGVTTLMGGLSGILAGTTPLTGTCDHSALEAQRDQAVKDRDLFEAGLERECDETDPASLAGKLAKAKEANRDLTTRLDTAKADLNRERDETDPASLAGKLKTAEEELTKAKEKIELIPELDLTKRNFGGKQVLVPLATAQESNSVRSDLRGLFGLDVVNPAAN